MRLQLLALLSMLTVTSTGCLFHSCTDEARSSLSLQVVDSETGEDVEAEITFLVDGEGPRSPESSSVFEHKSYILAYEQEGTFEVTISADGYQTVTTEYEIESDECHVISQSDTIELMPTP